ncbi:MAG: CvpA family protein [Rikenellaceae bacterium]|nr:CvpA family protein [Rikenellaceae bacterium]
MIDIIVIIAAIMAFYTGYRRGFIVQLISLVGLYIAVLLAPTIAKPVGSIFISNEYMAYVAGFFLVLAVALFIMWFAAPLIGKLIFWNPFERLDALMGGLLNLVVMIIVTSALFAAFDYANISSKPKMESINEYVVENVGSGDIEAKVKALADGDIETMRKFFEPRFVEYETLESSALFDPLAGFGRFIAPSMDGFNKTMREEAKESINEQVFFKK